MKTVQTLMAASLLTIVGATSAHAAINTYNVGLVGASSGLSSGTLTGSGTATFDDVSNTLTVHYTALNDQPLAGGTFTTDITTVFTGTSAGGLFTNDAGTSTFNNCIDGTTACPAAITGAYGIAAPLSVSPGLFNAGGLEGGGLLAEAFNIAAGGVNTSQVISYGGALGSSLTYTFTNTTPAVPVPAAAWLFGSGLLGLAGTARRRRQA